MANPAIAHADPEIQTPADPTVAADVLTALRTCVVNDANWEIKDEDGSPTKKWFSAGPVAGSPNVDLRVVVWCASSAPTAVMSYVGTGSANRIYAGMAPFGGGATIGDPGTASAATLFTGGTSKQNHFFGLGPASANISASLNNTVGIITTPESMIIFTRPNAGDVTYTVAWLGALASPAVDGHGGATDDRFYVQDISGDGAGSPGIPADTLRTNGLATLLGQNDEAFNTRRSLRVLDPVTEDTTHTIKRCANWPDLAADWSDDGPNNGAALEYVFFRYASGPYGTGRFGFLRNAYVWGQDRSQILKTTGGGATVIGRTFGRTESSDSDCFLLGRTV